MSVRPVVERIEEQVIPEPNSGCWLWMGSVDRDGYGRISTSPKSGLPRNVLVHRAMYAHYQGRIPDGLTIDHLCRVRCCCNPDHMEPVSNVTNVMRGMSPAAENARKTICKRGHPLSGGNLFVNTHGERQCRECLRVANRLRQRRYNNSDPSRYRKP